MSETNGFAAEASTSNGGASTTSSASTTMTSDNPNMHFDTQSGKWIFENPETGEELEWNIAANAWMPVVDDEVLAAQQAAYAVDGVDESTPAATLLARDRRKKRKAGADGEAGPSKKAARQKPGPRNTAVFIQRLPPDATLEEINEVFSKAGFILPDADGKPKIKLYTDKTTGLPNGDGLVVFLKEESVPLAISLLDDSPLRLGEKDAMKVAKAEWSHKIDAAADGKGENGDKPAAPQKRKGKSDGQAQKMQKRAEKLLRDAADYDPSYNEQDSGLAVVAKEAIAPKPVEGGRVVVLQHVFTLQELEEDASLLLELKEDVREECENLGKVTSIVLYDKEPDGVVTIKFSEPIAAQACIAKNNNRFFGGRQLKAWLYDGKTRYKKSGGIESAILEGESGEAAERRRLEEFGRWLENDPA